MSLNTWKINCGSFIMWLLCLRRFLLFVFQDTVLNFNPYAQGGQGDGTGYVYLVYGLVHFLDSLSS